MQENRLAACAKHFPGDGIQRDICDSEVDENGIVIYALFSRPFGPMGFLDFHSRNAGKRAVALQYGKEKTAMISFGSPYFGNQYFKLALTYVNAYSMLAPSAEAFVKVGMGEISFTSFSPVNLYFLKALDFYYHNLYNGFKCNINKFTYRRKT